ncbi:MAG: T9SS type A sorting domain-containing protein [Ignavibacteria bacterium]|nr:T9SS type A sorting domain-containing protein [Ignavibacteria bacterium]
MTQYAAGASQIKVRFRLSSDEGVTDDGWYVDDVKIITYNVGPVGIKTDEQIAGSFSLLQNYPNPFNPVTVISYNIAVAGFVELKIYDVLGNEVKTLVKEKQNAGSYSVDFNAGDLPSGVYFYSLWGRQ